MGDALIADDLDVRRRIFLAGLYRAEREIAAKLNALAVGKPPWPLIDADEAISWVEKRAKLALAESQQEAIRVALGSKVLVITGGPSKRRQDDAGQFDPQDPRCEDHCRRLLGRAANGGRLQARET